MLRGAGMNKIIEYVLEQFVLHDALLPLTGFLSTPKAAWPIWLRLGLRQDE
jgi:hypothetical protein